MTEALIGFAAMLLLIFLRVPVAFSMALVGFIGVGIMRNWPSAYAMTGAVVRESGFQYLLSVLPLFILMGNFITQAKLSKELYAAAYAFLGHRKGGLAMSTVVACGGFGAVCGSSLATAATMSKVAYPQMRRLGYSRALASGSIAAGGTLGILIPPSIVMVVYAILTEQSIGKMFAAGVLPGLLAVGLYLLAVRWTIWRDPNAGPPGERMSWKERLSALRDVWGVLVLFIIVMGGIYGGVFSSTEAAGIGACGAFLFALLRGRLTWQTLSNVLVESARTTGMLFLVLIGALLFSSFINFTSMPSDLQDWVQQFEMSPIVVILLICAIYIVLGSVLESMSMVLLTVPIFYPLVQHLGFDLVWFGIIVVVVTEISFITPPVGMNVMVLKSLLPDVKMGTLYRGVLPFVVADIFRLAVLLAFPVISLLLPKYLG
ncbi:TRAP transporter large permease [Alcaligenes aquatilis]|jgi:tripartite ATP-independent transporter DctM subunit|uniref:TRAP transporter large permease protein n=2 Tax=Alcaligenes TaxID=507 RepID=A0AB33D4C5_ALCFA|nr:MULTISPECIES: TRAP transporter large permease [Alcaligenes]ASR91063.1 C4-dicarboxylate ABC transporter permease [Alcaligenes faecalis]AWG36270.1 C4-dicarboxylate ABC transporter permease [Alcaligenes aquatilis]MCC9164711.1 TRAP transporter large permease [Alcaligenes sp. MMA]MCH4225333.1 TRAP transporter large permease [Alcaligenes faecalis]QXR35748.1 TRAP transporter large permease [Alcaligenes aquatilis]